MLAVKNAVFLFAILVSFLFPSENTLFISLIIALASVFCDIYEYKNNIEHPRGIGKVGATYLGAAAFFCMLLCTIASICYDVKMLPNELIVNSSNEVGLLNQPQIPYFIFHLSDKISSESLKIPYIIFSASAIIVIVSFMGLLSYLKIRDARVQRFISGHCSFQDLVDSL